MKQKTLDNLMETLDTIQATISTFNCYNFETNQVIDHAQMESYVKNLYISFVLKAIIDRADQISSNKIIKKLCAGFNEYLTETDYRFDSLAGLTMDLINKYSARSLFNDRRGGYKEVLEIMTQFNTQLEKEKQPRDNIFNWEPGARAFGPTEDLKHPDYNQPITVKSARK